MFYRLKPGQKTLLFSIVGVILLVFLALNVIGSHVAYAPLMYRIMEMQDPDAAREFLANLEGSGLEYEEVRGVRRVGASEVGFAGMPFEDVIVQESVYAQQSRYLNSRFDNVFAREVDVSRLNTEKAIDYYEDLLVLNEKNPQVLVKLGLLYSELGDSKRAGEYFVKAREVDPWIE